MTALAMRRRLDPELVSELHQLADRARVLAEASAGPLEHAGGRQHPGSRIPYSAGPSTLDEIAGRLARVRDDGDLRALIAWTKDEIKLITHGPEREPETPEQFRYRLCTDYEGYPAQYVADKEHISLRLVWKIRREDGRDGRRGLKKAGAEPLGLSESLE